MNQTSQKYKIDIIIRSSASTSPKKFSKGSPACAVQALRKTSKQICIPFMKPDQFNSSHQNPLETATQQRAAQLQDQKGRITSIINQCFGPPISCRERKDRLFAEKCIEMLHKKRKRMQQGNEDTNNCNGDSIKNMMNSIIKNYRRVQQNRQEGTIVSLQRQQLTLSNSISLKRTIGLFEDKVQLYRLMKSTKNKTNPNLLKLERNTLASTPMKRTNQNIEGEYSDMRKSKTYKKYSTIDGVRCLSLTLSKSQTNNKNPPSRLKDIALRSHTSQSKVRRQVSNTDIVSLKFLAIRHNDEGDNSYTKRLRSFLDFLFKINFSNQIYVSLKLTSTFQKAVEQSVASALVLKYKAYVGRGNNCMLIKSLLKRRFWIQMVNDINCEDLMFCWTQNTVQSFQQKQVGKVKYPQPLITLGGQCKPSKRQPMHFKEEQYQQNKKILSGEDIWNVEKHITQKGYSIPYRENYSPVALSNHVPCNYMISSKKKLHFSMFLYYQHLKKNPYDYLPKTYHVSSTKDFSFQRFAVENRNSNSNDGSDIWIVKPAQQTNRGQGIRLARFANVPMLIQPNKKHLNGHAKTYIIQSYIAKPLLYNGRKIDIRHFMLLTSVNGYLKAYWYKQGYVRTSSEQYETKDLQNKYIHLTNDAIQNAHPNYGYFQPGNKLSYNQFSRYLESQHKMRNFQSILKQMKAILIDVVKANYKAIDPARKQNNFEIFGVDFMIDKDLKPWLIEINSNPCLQMSSPILSRIIPTMLENSLRIGLDPLLPPKNHYPTSKRYNLSDNILRNIKYQLIFDETALMETISIQKVEIQEDEVQKEQQYPNEGDQIEDIVFL